MARINGNKTSKRSSVANATTGNADGYLGDLVAWIFADDDGFSVDRKKLHALFEQHGFGELIERDRSVADAIRGAARKVKKGHGFIAKEIDRHRKDTPTAIAVYKKSSSEGEVGDEWIAGARVRVQNDVATALPLEGQTTADPDCLQIAEAIAKKSNEYVANVTNNELSFALCEAGRKSMWATFRRKQGGVWFVHARCADRFRALLDDVERLGGFFPIVQPLYADEQGRSERNVAEASKGMLQDELSRLTADLKRATDEGNMRDSTLAKRIRECDELLARADLYGTLLADKADAIRAKADEVKKRFGSLLDGEEDEVFGEIAETITGNAKFAAAASVVEESDDAEDLFGF